jgi:hypothetical protein
MQNNINKARSSAEGPNSGPGINRVKEVDSKEIKDVSALGKSAYVEAVGMDETVETTGQVSEVLSSTREQQGDGGSGGQAKKDDGSVDPEELKAKLLKNLPHQRVMKRQIEKEIKKEINYLHGKAMAMVRSPKEMNYFEMNNIVGKIRELRKLLKSIVKASFEAVKGVWLRYVHGIM